MTALNSEKLFRLLVTELRDYGIFICDLKGRITSWNEGAARIFGYSEEEVLGLDFGLTFTPEDREAGIPARELATAKQNGRAEDRRWHLKKGGQRFFADGITTTIRDENEHLIAYSKVCRDITEKKLSERRLSVQLALAQVLTLSSDYAETACRILQTVCETLEWDMGALWEPSADRGTLIPVEHWFRPEFSPGLVKPMFDSQELRRGMGLPGRVWESGLPSWIPDLQVDRNFARLDQAGKLNLRAGFAFPITSDGQVLGVMEFFSRLIRQPEPELMGTMAAVGSQIGQFFERRRAEEGLRVSEERYRVITETSHDAVFTINQQSRILFVNKAGEEMFGYEPGELVGQPLSVLIPQNLRAAHHHGIERYVRTGKRNIPWDGVELPGLHKSGREFPLELSFGEVSTGGQHLFTGYARDISQRKKVEEERERLLQEANAANQAKDVFLATISHELRTPMTSILGWVKILSGEDCDGETFRTALEMIESSARSQASLIDDLLDVSRIISGKLRLEMRQADLAAVIEDAAGALQPSARAKGLELRVLTRSITILGDPNRLQQVVSNLVANAIKFTPAGGWVEVSLEQHDSLARIKVTDTGRGIDPTLMEKIFNPFQQADDAKGGGLGLGLSIVRHLVELHHGKVKVESEGANKGSTFTVELPLFHEGHSQDNTTGIHPAISKEE